MIKSTKEPGLLLFLSGLITSGIALGIVFLINQYGFDIMGFYLWFIVPVGAIFVGIASGLGYFIYSKLSNIKAKKPFLLFVFLLALTTYVLAQYITYLSIINKFKVSETQFSFFGYIRFICEGMTYSTMESNSKSVALGMWGYIFKFLEAIGFCIGAIVPTFSLRSKPYCINCQLYMKKLKSFFISSTSSKDDLKKKKKNEKNSIILNAIEEILNLYASFKESIENEQYNNIEGELNKQEESKPKKAIAYIQTDLYKCLSCNKWHIVSHLSNITINNQIKTKKFYETI